MAADLRQLKAYITPEADVMIDVFAEVDGRDRSEIVRDVMHEWALRQMRLQTVARRKFKAEGHTGSPEVQSGTVQKLRPASQD